MKFSIRDLLWATAVVTLISAWTVASRRQQTYAQSLQKRVARAEKIAAASKRAASRDRMLVEEMANQTAKMERAHRSEVLELRQVLKDSLHDRRDWFELQVAGNRIVAIRPGSLDSRNVNAEVAQRVERATGLEAKRLKHFLKPIEELRPTSR